MKKRIICFAALWITISACKKEFLNLSPETVQDQNTFYQTGDQFIQAVNGAYAPLQALFNSYMWAFAEMRSDNTSYQFNTGDNSGLPLMQIDEHREINSNTQVLALFNNCYSGISRCNEIILRSQTSTVAATILDPVVGQAFFLRAFNYYNLVRLIGDVPLVLTPISSVDAAFLNSVRKPAAQVYDAIISDATAAIQKLPDSYSNTKDKGRVTKAAALVLLAKVYMDQKKFDPALQQLRLVTNYKLLPDYAGLFLPANKNNAESIFEIQYSVNSPGENSNFIYVFAPYNAGTSITGYGLLGGAGSGWNIPTQDMLEAYEPGDLRKDASVSTEFTDPNTGKMVPYIKKYKHPHAVRNQTDDDFPVYRYADVKLMMAECLNEKGFVAGGEAFTHLNDVRSRAGLAPKVLTTQDAFRTAVWQERRVELAFEDHRWFDLLRYGTAQAVMTAHGIKERALKASYLPADSYTNIHMLFPYPLREEQLKP